MSTTDDVKKIYDYITGSEYAYSKLTKLKDIPQYSNIAGIAEKKGETW